MEPRFDNLDGKPEILYPCRWQYKMIGPSEELMRAAIVEIVADLDHSLSLSRSSRGGKYCSMLLAITVASEAQRNEIFAALRNHRSITMVL